MSLRIAALVSGSGSNLQAILDACAQGRIDGEVVLVLSNRTDAFALERARRAGVPTEVLDHKNFASREAFDSEIVDRLRTVRADTVVLAGFMRIVTPVLLSAFTDRVINVHPSLLPSFAGTHAQAQALAYGAKIAGCTVHFVDEGVDSGPIIAQAAVDVFDTDTEESLRDRILREEHRILPLALSWLAEGRLLREGRLVRVSKSKPK
ncbi:MAG: phosphoribosylglycinamide formyltransferase [Deltaproteobacteria bacterium]|nr:phosphoribosylglycinamide formyltransferase [Deltaproteobacteria bacterium]